MDFHPQAYMGKLEKYPAIFRNTGRYVRIFQLSDKYLLPDRVLIKVWPNVLKLCIFLISCPFSLFPVLTPFSKWDILLFSVKPSLCMCSVGYENHIYAVPYRLPTLLFHVRLLVPTFQSSKKVCNDPNRV